MKSFVDSIKKIDSTNNSYLINNILWSSSITRITSNNKRFAFFPINIVGDDSTTNGLVAVLDNSSYNIIDAYFVQVANSNKTSNGNGLRITSQQISTSVNALENHISKTNFSFTGSIQFYNLYNKMIYTAGYLSGKRNYVKMIAPENSSPQSGIARQSNSTSYQQNSCTNYYLVTYYDDGTTDREFLFQTCNNCQQTAIINEKGTRIYLSDCGGGTSPSGGGASVLIQNTPTPIPVKKIKNRDGTYTLTFTDNSLPGATADFVVKLDANNNLIPGSQGVTVSGSLSLTMSTVQNPQDYTNTSNPNSTQVAYFIQGTFSLFGVLPSWAVQPSIIITIPNNLNPFSGTGTTATVAWGWKLSGSKYNY